MIFNVKPNARLNCKVQIVAYGHKIGIVPPTPYGYIVLWYSVFINLIIDALNGLDIL